MKKTFFYLTLLIASISFIYSGCKKDNSLEPQEEHFEAIGVYLSTSGIKVASILKGETSDTLYAPLNDLSDQIEVQFYDDHTNIVDPPTDEGQTLSWEIGDESIAEVFQDPGHEGEFEFHLRGKSAGSTTIELFIMHNNHSDFKSGKIPLVVK